jgi:hypothetical protein
MPRRAARVEEHRRRRFPALLCPAMVDAATPSRTVAPHRSTCCRCCARRSAPVYHLRDTHWNAAGNRVAGEAIASWILAHRGAGGHPG